VSYRAEGGPLDSGEDVIKKAIVWKSIKKEWNDDFIFPIPEGFTMPWLGGEVINTSWSYYPKPPPGHQQRLGNRMEKPVHVQRIDVTFEKVDHLEEIEPDELGEIREGFQALKKVGPAPNVSHRVITGRSRKRKAILPRCDSFKGGTNLRKGATTVVVVLPERRSPEKKRMKCMTEVERKSPEKKRSKSMNDVLGKEGEEVVKEGVKEVVKEVVEEVVKEGVVEAVKEAVKATGKEGRMMKLKQAKGKREIEREKGKEKKRKREEVRKVKREEREEIRKLREREKVRRKERAEEKEEKKKKERKRKCDTFSEGFPEAKRKKITRGNEMMKRKSDLQVDEWVVSIEPEPPPEPTG